MDKLDKFYCNIAAAQQLDDKYCHARNEDFETFSESEYLFIQDHVRSRIKEGAFREADNPVAHAKEMHRQISQLIESNPLFVKSKIRRWALTLLVNTVDQFREDLDKETDLNDKIIMLFYRDPNKINRILTSILHFLESYEEEVSGKNIATCVYNFGEIVKKLKDSFHFEGEAKAFIERITYLLKKSVRNLDSGGIGTTIYGILNLPDCEETRSLIDAVTDSAERYRPKLNKQCIGMSLYGLQNFHKSDEVLRYIKIITELIKRDKVELNARSLNNALFGLQNLIDLEELDELKEYLIEQVNNLDADEIQPIPLLSLVQSLKIIGVRVPSSIWRAYHQYINEEGNKDFGSDSEKEAFKILRDRFPNRIIYHNYYLDGFELDIYLPQEKINIEIDGAYHNQNSVREDKRDQYLLEKHGITIVRIPAKALNDKNYFIDLVHEKMFGFAEPRPTLRTPIPEYHEALNKD